jgi:hypothetical protein
MISRRRRRLPPLPLALLVLAGTSAALAWRGSSARADEGQWLPEQIRHLDFTALKARGLELGADEIWNGEEGLLTAAAQINGCSSSFVSEQGLIVTNHHCGFAAISAASTVEQNLLENGFVSRQKSEEIPAPGYSVSFVRGMDDVTAEIRVAAERAGDDPAARWRAVQAERRRLEEEVNGTFESAIVVSYFEGRIWRRIRRTVLRDVRLVYAPPRDVGEFGGETDNWIWPRHTGDFCFFRAYVAPDGSPAEFSDANVPYEPTRWLEVSTEGVEEEDLVMVLGYPGRTNRYATALAVEAAESYTYPMRSRVFTEIIGIYERDAAGDPAKELQHATAIKSLANVKKNADGQVWGLARNAVVERKNREETEFRAWVAADQARARRFGTVLDDLIEIDRLEVARIEHDFMLSQLLGLAAVRNGAAEGAELAIAQFVTGLAAELPEGQRVAGFDRWAAANNRDGWKGLAEELKEEGEELRTFRDAQSGRRMEVGALWIEAQELWRGKRFYPDANSTLRLSVASVRGYEPRDGIQHLPFTTVDGMMQKHIGAGEFDVPDAVLAAVERDPAVRKLRVCFLSDADTTGGNSGSPVVDGQGRLVGLNFDRVFENVAGDFGWNPERSRNICVDIRYVLWLMREVWPAPALLAEMKVK